MKSKITVLVGSLLVAISIMTFANHTAFGPTKNMNENAPTPHQKKVKQNGEKQPMSDNKMQFGNFSVSLTVKDLKTSKAFYEKLDFQHVFGEMEQNYLIMQNGTTTIGLFQGMFEKNILTFNPGWNHKAEALKEFQDARDLQATLKNRGITPVQEADESSDGPASFVIVDPDGNPILVDQHVPKPK